MSDLTWKQMHEAAVEQLAAVTAERDKLKAEREQMERQEPFTKFVVYDDGDVDFTGRFDATQSDCLQNGEYNLFIHQAKPVPDGKVLVPVKPTDSMVRCGFKAVKPMRKDFFLNDATKVWEAMLKAAQHGE